MKPIYLFRFVEGTLVTTQTSGPKAVVYDAGLGDEIYTPYAIGRGGIESKNEISRANLEVKMALNNPFAQRHMAQVVDSVVSLTMFRNMEGVISVEWKGRLASVKLTNKQVNFVFESVFTSLRRPGLRARYQKSCRHALYGKGCKVDPELHGAELAVNTVNGSTVVMSDLAGFPNARFRGGMIKTLDDNVVRFIVDHTGNTLTLSRPFEKLQAAATAAGPGNLLVKLYPGCRHNMDDCDNVFDNLDNYGGFPWIPNINPLGGSSIV